MIRAVFAVLFICFFIPLWVYSQNKSEDHIKKHYLDICQVRLDNGGFYPLLKWNRDIRFTIIGNRASKWDNRIRKWIKEMEEFIPYRIKYVTNPENADLTIFIGDIYLYKLKYLDKSLKLPEFSNNYFTYQLDGEKNFQFVSFCVDVDRAFSVRHKKFLMFRLLFKSLGLIGHSSGKYTIFNDYAEISRQEIIPKIWDKDLEALKIHYSESLKSGMNRTQVKEIVQALEISF